MYARATEYPRACYLVQARLGFAEVGVALCIGYVPIQMVAVADMESCIETDQCAWSAPETMVGEG